MFPEIMFVTLFRFSCLDVPCDGPCDTNDSWDRLHRSAIGMRISGSDDGPLDVVIVGSSSVCFANISE